jgi:hypothetical protein
MMTALVEIAVEECLTRIGNPSGSLDECLEASSQLVKLLGEDEVKVRIHKSFEEGWPGTQGKGYRVLSRMIQGVQK